MDERPKRKPRTTPPGPAGNAITPFNRTGKLPPLPEPAGAPNPDNPFMVRLDPNAKPGEFNFVIEGPETVQKGPPQVGLEAEASGYIPPVLFRAVDEVLGFIYSLDQQFENQGRRPKR